MQVKEIDINTGKSRDIYNFHKKDKMSYLGGPTFLTYSICILSKSMIKYPVYKYGRHTQMWIEAPVSYIRICPSSRSDQDNKLIYLFFKKNERLLFQFCHSRPIYQYVIWAKVCMTPVSWCFAIKCMIIYLLKNAHPF